MSWDRSHEFICSEGLVTRNIGLKKLICSHQFKINGNHAGKCGIVNFTATVASALPSCGFKEPFMNEKVKC